MNKIALFFSIILFFSFQFPDKKKVKFTCEITNVKQGDSLYLYQFNGLGFELYQQVATQDGQNFIFEVPAGEAEFYYAGTKDMKVKSALLGEEAEVLMKASLQNMRRAKFDSGINALYNKAMEDSRRLRNEQITLNQQFRRVMNNSKSMAEVSKEMALLDDKKRKLLEDTTKENAFVGKIIALYTYLSFQNNNTQDYKYELDYFINEYFAQANLKDKDYDRTPMLYDAFNSYTTMLCKTNALDKEKMGEVLNKTLSRFSDKSIAYKYALGGMCKALQAQNHSSFLDFGNKYVEKYKKDKSAAMQRFATQVANAKAFLPGGEAPDFTQNDPTGKAVSLSDFRGKVLLVDFWASWCGPCRKENPHVVELYHKYKDKGFEVLGVSLDKDMNRWVQAIDKDGLEWSHVSDLKGWKNEVAQLYSVSSVPHTILLDEKGRIIARKLRSQQLEAKLKEIFGE